MNITLSLKPASEAPYSKEIIDAYKKVLATSEKYDVEYRTEYGKRAMRKTYDVLCGLCRAEGLRTLDVCGELSGYDI